MVDLDGSLLALRWCNVIISVIALVLCVFDFRRRGGYMVGPFMWILHVLVFDTARVAGIPLTDAQFSFWGHAVILHGEFLLLGVLVTEARKRAR